MKSGKQGGIVLIEVLVAALLFVLGLLGLVGVAGKSVSDQSDIEYRTQAANMASQIMDTIWLNVDRSTPANVAASLLTFQHQATTNGNCNFGGAASAQAQVTTWVNRVVNGAIVPPAAVADPKTRLPGSTAVMQQILFNAANGNEVTVRLCWQSASDPVPRQHVLRAYVN